MTNPRRALIGLTLAISALAATPVAVAGDEAAPQITKHYVTLGGGQLHYVTLASPTSDLDDVLAVFIIGLDARTRPYDMHHAIFGYEGWTDSRTIETPTMLLCGDGDFFVNQERLDYTCTLFPNCEVHPLIENAGAFIGLEQPEAYAGAIIEFLKRP